MIARFAAAIVALNRAWTARIPSLAILVAAFLLSWCGYILPLALSGDGAPAPLAAGRLDAPPPPGDGTSYDNLAMQLAAGKGFRFDWDDPAYRATYEGRPGYESRLEKSGSWPTAKRPPLYPLAMSLVYRAVGRNFSLIHCLNAAAMALAGCLACAMILGDLGLIPAALFLLLFWADGPLHAHAPRIMTESPAALGLTALAALLVRLWRTGSAATAAAAGLIYGLAILLRFLFSLYAPFLLLFLFLRGASRSQGWPLRRNLLGAGCFLAAALAVLSPWAARNVLVLGLTNPLSTQGAIYASAAYSDRAVENRGRWVNLDAEGFFDPVEATGATGLELEKAMAAYSQARAAAWVRQHPWDVPKLALWKVLDLWAPVAAAATWRPIVVLYALALLGLLAYPRRERSLLTALLLLANTAAVAATWSVGLRFQVPLLPLLTVAAAGGAWWLVERCAGGAGHQVGSALDPLGQSTSPGAPHARGGREREAAEPGLLAQATV